MTMPSIPQRLPIYEGPDLGSLLIHLLNKLPSDDEQTGVCAQLAPWMRMAMSARARPCGLHAAATVATPRSPGSAGVLASDIAARGVAGASVVHRHGQGAGADHKRAERPVRRPQGLNVCCLACALKRALTERRDDHVQRVSPSQCATSET